MKEGQQNVVKDPHANPHWAEYKVLFIVLHL